jgi:hypothetical protein
MDQLTLGIGTRLQHTAGGPFFQSRGVRAFARQAAIS